MTHISLDTQDEAVKQFVLKLMLDPSGSILELDGQPVACIVPPPQTPNGAEEFEWSDVQNARRVDLIKKKHAAGLPPAEHLELANLQAAMLRYRQQVAPLPLAEARQLHQELLTRAAQPSSK